MNKKFNVINTITALLIFLLGGFTPAKAQPDSAQSNGEQQIDLSAQPLQQSLVELGATYGVTIVSQGGITANKRGAAVTGSLTLDEALTAVLRGTGLETRRSTSGSLVVQQRNPTATNSNPELSGASSRGKTRRRQPKPIEEIIVTGQQIDRSLQETKESVALVSAETIDQRTLLDIEDVLLQTANIAPSASVVGNVSIRGISRAPFAIGGVGDTSNTFYDDVAITNQALGFISRNTWDVEQIEVLRGPQSTNVGRNALAGALVIRTRNPQLNDFEAAARVEAGNADTFAYEGMVNVPVTKNSALRITGERSVTEGFVDNVTTGATDDGREEFTTVRAKYLVEFSDRFSALASIQYVDGLQGEGFYVAPADGPLDSFERRNNAPSFFGYEGTTGSLNLTYDFANNWTLQSITAFSDGDSEFERDIDATEFDIGTDSNPQSQFNVSQELRLSFEGNKLRGVVGGYYLDDDRESFYRINNAVVPSDAGVPPFLLPFFPEFFTVSQVTESEFESENFAFFTQWDYFFSDKLTFSTGLRYDQESFDRQSMRSVNLDPSTPLPDPVAAGMQAEALSPGSGAAVEGGVAQVNGFLSALLGSTTNDVGTTFEALLPEAGITYAFNDDFRASLFYKRGYRAGGSQIVFGGDVNEFDPEFIENFELSLRSEWLDNTLTINANAYLGFWNDQQVNVPINGNPLNTRTVNAGESRIWGFEAEADYTPGANTQLFVSVGYAQTEFKEFCRIGSTVVNLSECVVDGVTGSDLAGNEFGLSPDWTVSAGGEHFLTDRIFLQANATYQSGSFGTVDNEPETLSSGLLLVNASLGYQRDRFDVRFYVRNLFDEFDTLSIAPFGANGDFSIVPSTPRQFGLIVSARY
ncbi:MAG: TonB-dependent receptor [Pseudomonadota bacterium]